MLNKHKFRPNSSRTSNNHVPKIHLITLQKDKETVVWSLQTYLGIISCEEMLR